MRLTGNICPFQLMIWVMYHLCFGCKGIHILLHHVFSSSLAVPGWSTPSLCHPAFPVACMHSPCWDNPVSPPPLHHLLLVVSQRSLSPVLPMNYGWSQSLPVSSPPTLPGFFSKAHGPGPQSATYNNSGFIAEIIVVSLIASCTVMGCWWHRHYLNWSGWVKQ